MVQQIILRRAAAEIITSEIKEFGHTETGGVLMGRVEKDSIVIEIASGAGPSAIHESIYFQADSDFIDMFVDMEYANSNGQNIYLGEWHTHPEKYPSPSSIDLQSIDEISDNCDEMVIMIIFGAVAFNIKEVTTKSYAVIKFRNDKRFLRIPVFLEQ